MQANIKTKNGKELQVDALVDSRCTYIEIDKQLVKDKRIQTKPVDSSFKVFNADGTKNGEVTRIVLLEVKFNEYKKQIDVVITDLNGTDCYDSKLKVLSNEITLVLSNTRELDRVPSTK